MIFLEFYLCLYYDWGKEDGILWGSFMKESEAFCLALRLSSQEKALLESAALDSHLTLEDFVYQAAMQAAQDCVLQQSRVVFTASEAQQFIEALDRPFVPNTKLKEAIELASRVEKEGRLS